MREEELEGILSAIWRECRWALNEPHNIKVLTGFFWTEELAVAPIWCGTVDDSYTLERLVLERLTREEEYFLMMGFPGKASGAWWLMPSDWNDPPGVHLENCTLRATTYELHGSEGVERWQCIFPIGFDIDNPNPQADLMPIYGEFPWELLTNSN